jgi:hypothetical protein
MRTGLVFSIAGHVALLLWGFVLFANPREFAPIPPEAITVDIVPATAMAQELAAAEPRPESAPARQPAGPEPEKQPAQERTPDPQQTRTASASPQPPQPAGTGTREPLRASPAQPEPPPNLLVFNATVAPVRELPLSLGDAQNPGEGFDAPAGAKAKLSREEIAAFRAHLQKCWNAPAELADAQRLKIVLRISLHPNGTLTGNPMLIEASASGPGPALVTTAMNALRQCQPYGFLPAGKYQEWKLLDLSFSPYGLSGG